MNDIKTRQSIREFKDKKIPQEIIDKILIAGMSAPSGFARFPIRYMLIKDKKHINTIVKCGEKMIQEFTLNILVLIDQNAPVSADKGWGDLSMLDASASMENILLEAHFNKLGAVWAGIYPKKSYMKKIQKIFNLPNHLIPFSFAIIGYPKSKMKNKKRTLKNEWIIDELKFKN